MQARGDFRGARVDLRAGPPVDPAKARYVSELQVTFEGLEDALDVIEAARRDGTTRTLAVRLNLQFEGAIRLLPKAGDPVLERYPILALGLLTARIAVLGLEDACALWDAGSARDRRTAERAYRQALDDWERAVDRLIESKSIELIEP
jgi:hypothetical protein